MSSKTRKGIPDKKSDDRRLYSLQVVLIGGPVTEDFAKKNKVVSRTIEIRGDQTLEDLHCAIFKAFDRDDEHLYEFQIGGKRINDPKARRYVLPQVLDDGLFGERQEHDLTEAKIGSLGLKLRRMFAYWFDYGDDWWHRIDVVGIADEVPKGKYPRITERVGESPPQYPDCEEEDAVEEGDEEE